MEGSNSMPRQNRINSQSSNAVEPVEVLRRKGSVLFNLESSSSDVSPVYSAASAIKSPMHGPINAAVVQSSTPCRLMSSSSGRSDSFDSIEDAEGESSELLARGSSKALLKSEKAKYEVLERKFNDVQCELYDVKSQFIKMKAEVDTKKMSVDSIRPKLEKTEQALLSAQKEIASLKEQLASVSTEKYDLSTTVESQKSTITLLRGELDAANQTKRCLQTQNKDLRREVRDHHAKLNALSRTVNIDRSTAKSKENAFMTQLTMAKTDVLSAALEREAVEGERDLLATELNASNEEIEKLLKKIQMLERFRQRTVECKQNAKIIREGASPSFHFMQSMLQDDWGDVDDEIIGGKMNGNNVERSHA